MPKEKVPALSRIYQGRVIRLKILEDKKSSDDVAVPEARMEELLSRHHAEFQRAVNYHQFQLLRLSTDETSALGKIRKRMVESDVAARRLRAKDWRDDTEKRHLQDKAAHDVWNDFRRDGRGRPGMGAAINALLGLPADASLEEAIEAAGGRFNSPEISAELYDLAVQALVTDLGGDGAIRNKGNEYLPRFCWRKFNGGFPRTTTARGKKAVQEALPARLHDPETATDLEALMEDLKFEDFANVNEQGERLDRARCLELFGEGMKLLVLESGLSDADAVRLMETRNTLPADFSLPSYRGASVKGVLRNRFFAFLVLKHLEASSVTFQVLRDTYPVPKEKKESKKKQPKESSGPDLLKYGDDPVKLARGSKGVVYPGFTSLSGWLMPKPGEMGWKEFDIAAFKEALKAFNQVKGRAEEREEKRAGVLDTLRYMENGGKAPKSKSGEDEDETDVATFAGDERFPAFKTLLETIKKQKNDEAEEYAADAPHDLRYRAIRGRKDLFVEWNKHLKKRGDLSFDKDGLETSLLEMLNEHQKEHRDDMGWSLLFRELCKEGNFGYWREPTPELAAQRRDAGHSSDFLGDYVKWAELVIDAERLAEPIRFSPADEEQSRRLFMFSDACAFTKGGEYRHISDATAVIVPMAVEERGMLMKRRVRLDYSAPRLLRDGLRGEDGTVWNQPMMAALGIEAADAKQDISKSAVALMPDRDREKKLRFLLNFPLSLEHSAVAAKVAELRGQSVDWAKQSVSYGKGAETQHFYLRWPGFDKEADKVKPWHEQTGSFRVLSVDLGVRFAGACARVRAYAGKEKEEKRDRHIGTVGSQDWHAQVERLITIRLPGEGRRGMDFGDHPDGRWAKADEILAARGLILSLALHPKHLGFEGGKYRVGEVAAKLLVALRRAMAHLRLLQRWGRMDQNWDEVKKEIGESHQREFKLREEAEKRGEEVVTAEWSNTLSRLPSAADCQIEAAELKEKLKEAVEKVAGFLVPLRHGSWLWYTTIPGIDGRPPCHELKRMEKENGTPANPNRDQGGLSVKRIDRITDFRKILQSFNRLYGLKEGATPPSGREMRSQPLPDPCPALSAKLEAMKEQRVDQTAHWILAEALGLELRDSTRTPEERRKLDLHGEYHRKREPVDFIVLEDLSRYRTTQSRTRQENSRLMQWCHRQVTAKLKMLCEAYGLVVLETPAAYSSRFCSLTGQPGFRAEHVTKKTFESDFHWRETVARAERDADLIQSKNVLAARDWFRKQPDDSKKTLLLPRAGGEVFVPAGPGMIQNADLNAAVNLALRSIASPNCFDIHTRIRSEWVKDHYQTRETRNRFGAGQVKIDTDSSMEGQHEARPNFFLVPGGMQPSFGAADLEFPCVWSVFSGKAVWSAVSGNAWTRVLADVPRVALVKKDT